MFADGALPEKTNLIAVAVAHATQCPYCILGHPRLAHRAVTSDAEKLRLRGWTLRCAPAAPTRTPPRPGIPRRHRPNVSAVIGPVVVVGGAVVKTAEALWEKGFDGPLTLVGAEGHLRYERPPLSNTYLAGKSTFDEA